MFDWPPITATLAWLIRVPVSCAHRSDGPSNSCDCNYRQARCCCTLRARSQDSHKLMNIIMSWGILRHFVPTSRWLVHLEEPAFVTLAMLFSCFSLLLPQGAYSPPTVLYRRALPSHSWSGALSVTTSITQGTRRY